MKKLLPLLAIFTSLLIYSSTSAQCDISDLKVRLTNINTSTCEVTFDLSWTQEVNSGNKFAYVHLWTQSAYHTPERNWLRMYSQTGLFPMAGDLVNALGTIVIEDNHADYPYLGTVYHPDITYTLPELQGMSVVKVHLNNTLIERMTIKNVTLKLPSCSGAQTIMFDVWASQTKNGKNVHCASQGATIIINDVRVIGDIVCSNPPEFRVIIQNDGPALDNATYKVYLDYAPLGIINPSDTLVYSSDSISLPQNGFYTSPLTGYLPYSASYPGMPLIVELIIPGMPNSLVAKIENGCGALPVKFTDFTAMLAKDRVVLKWQTAFEQNSRGFNVERKFAGGSFESIAWVPSLALNGNSNGLLNYDYYDFTDLKNAGLIFYRVKQTDLDGNVNYTDVKYVKTTDGTDLLVFPNPSMGNVNIVIPGNTNTVDIVLTDITGKVIEKWSGVTSNHFELNNLKPGLYLLKLFVKQTGEMLTNKFVVL